MEQYARDGAIAEEAVHPLDDFGRNLLKHRRKRAFHGQRQRSLAALALRKADRFGRRDFGIAIADNLMRSEEHTSELQSLMRISSAVFCLKKKKHTTHNKS